MGGVSYAELFAGFFYYLAQGGVMDVADSVEQVVFDLEIQAAQEPAGDFASRAKSTVVSTWWMAHSFMIFSVPLGWVSVMGKLASSTQWASWKTTLRVIPLTKAARA